MVPVSEAVAEVRADYMAEMCQAIATAPTTTGLQRTYDNGFCRGLFEVVERLIDSGNRIGDPPSPPFSRVCRPLTWMRGWGDRTGSDVLVAVFVRYGNTLPVERRQEAFLNIAIESLERAFPCGSAPR
jgi:hypothetical protein